MGLLFAIDELQEVDGPTLSSLNTTIHRMGQGPEPSPFLFVGAGLPSLRRILSEATSYTERLFEYWQIGPLSDDAIRARSAGRRRLAGSVGILRPWTRASNSVVGTRISRRCWASARGMLLKALLIARDAVAEAIRYAGRDIDAGLYAARWQRAPPAASNGSCRLWLIGRGPVLHVELVTALEETDPRSCLRRATN